MTVNCWVRGQDLSTVFSVEIAPTKTVSILKRAIKDENLTRLRDIDANGLALYKVSILEKDLEETVKGLAFDHGEPLLATATLSEVFPDAPRGGHVHIIVEAPLSMRARRHQPPSSSPSLPVHNVEVQRHIFLTNVPSTNPSAAGMFWAFSERQCQPMEAILCNRPHVAQAAIPATLLHPAFGQFLDDCETHQVTEHDNVLAMELHVAMSNFDLNQGTRAETIRDVFAKWDLKFTISMMHGRYPTNG